MILLDIALAGVVVFMSVWMIPYFLDAMDKSSRMITAGSIGQSLRNTGFDDGLIPSGLHGYTD